MFHSRRIATACVGAAALLGVAACGGGGDEGDAEDTVKSFAGALADKDGKKACDQLAADAKNQFEQSGQKCEDLLQLAFASISEEERNELKDIEPDVSVDGDTATAKVPNIGEEGDSEIKLKKEDGDWKITDLGN
jgi:Domain of unknown function (DUF4878)